MYRDILNYKIGNILLCFSKVIEQLYLTKALKLLYLLDETSIREVGAPVTWLDYKVWKFGPVPESIYDEINSFKDEDVESAPLFKFIKVEKNTNPYDDEQDSIVIKAADNSEFDKSCFSEYELELITEILEKYKEFTSKELVNRLHEEGSLWDQIVKNSEIEFSFELNNNRSNFSIDFTKLLEKDKDKQEIYKSANNSLQFQRSLLQNS